MFDPVKITTLVSLAAAAIWAICFVRDAKPKTQYLTFGVTLVALGVVTWLEWSRHTDACSDSASLLINEFCAEGKECDGGYDFVELINPTDTPADLGCYALTDRRSTRSEGRMAGNPFLLPAGEVLQPNEVRAWDEIDMRLQLSRERRDRLRLSRFSLRPGKPLDLVVLDEVVIDPSHAYGFRQVGDLSWVGLDHEEVKKVGLVGTMGRANTKQLGPHRSPG